MKDELKVAEEVTQSIYIECTHRVGTKGDDRKRRIITHFLSWKQHINILERTRNKLNGSGSDIKIGEDFNKEVRETRRRLNPAMQVARDSGKATSLRYDKLYVDNKP